MSSQQDKIKQFMQQYLSNLISGGGVGENLSHPKFDLYARDYINFAEQELTARDDRSLINCVSHLKRAIDCQIDHFLYVFGLATLFEKRNLKFDKKLDFLKACGVFSSGTISRLNSIRNRMEHTFEIPKVKDLEAYFDLTSAFIAVIERTILFGKWNKQDFDLIIGDEPYEMPADHIRIAKYYFYIEYLFEKPEVKVGWKLESDEQDMTIGTEDINEFAYFFRIFNLLSQRDAFAGDKYILSQL